MFQNKLIFRPKWQFATRGRQIACLEWQIAILAFIYVGTREAVPGREKSPFLSPALYPLSLPTRDAPPVLFRVLKSYKTCSSLPSLATLLTLFGECFEGWSVSSSERPSSVSSIFEVVSSFRRSIHSTVVRSSFDRSFLTILSIK